MVHRCISVWLAMAAVTFAAAEPSAAPSAGISAPDRAVLKQFIESHCLACHDNITVADLSPALLNCYISAAQKISRLAIGSPGRAPGGDTFRIRPDVTQEAHVEGLPPGTRGGTSIPYYFPQAGEYEIQVHLM